MNLSMVRSAIESLYFDTATIIEFQEVFDPEDGSTGVEEIVVCENQPCKVSHEYVRNAEDGAALDGIILVSRLFISPDLDIKAGSKIIITRNGVDTVYENSGEPARYYNHQEIKIKLLDGEA